MKYTFCAVLLCVLVAGTATLGRAQDVKGLRADMIGNIEYAQKEILDLENAIPDAKMSWRPTKEVRSISEVYAHISFGNYLFCNIAGFTLPEGITLGGQDGETKWDKATTDKKALHEQLVKSFAYLKDQIKNVSDEGLEKTVNFFGNNMSTRALLIALVGHIHEHLGQSIAYARSVGVVPPWTAAQMAAAKEKK